MRRALAIIVTVMFAVLLSAPAATAASPHFKRNGTPTCTVSTTATSASTTCTGTMAGLGKQDVVINTTVAGFAAYQCQNPGGNTAPGQNRVLEGPTTSSTPFPSSAIKNGTLRFTTAAAVLTAEEEVSGAEAGCPGSAWTGVDPTLVVTDVALRIYQGGVLIFTCTASDPDGLPATFTLAC